MSLIRKIKDLARFEQVISTLFKYDLGYLIKRIKLHKFLSAKDRLKKQKFLEKEYKPKLLRKALEELGGGFIKLGQLLSLRPDLIPKEYCDEFSKLQDEVKAFPTEEAKSIIVTELKKSMKKIFKEFSDKPIAAASIGQVHRATLKSGEEVIVKVQRLGVKEKIQQDIDILKYLAELIDEHLSLEFVDFEGIVKEIERYTKDELDYLKEAHNINTFREHNKDDKTIIVPKVYNDLTTKKVLVMSFINGVEIKKIKKPNRKLANIVVNSVLKQVYIDGFFHADPHPSNILVVRNKIAFIDFGIIGRFNRDLRKKMFSLFQSLIERSSEDLVKALINLGVVEEEIDQETIKEDFSANFDKYYSSKLEEIDFGEVFHKITEIARKYKIKLPVDFVLYGKTVITVESVAEKLDPKFNIVKTAKPFIEKQLKKQLDPLNIFDEIKDNATRLADFLKNVPIKTRRILSKIDKTEKSLKEIDKDLKIFTEEVDKSSNRIAYAMILTGVLICSALLFNEKTYTILGISAFSFVGFIIAGIITMMIIVSVLKEKRFKR
ncbi:ABC1 kinase family protein [Nanoarchaeota archaeon]